MVIFGAFTVFGPQECHHQPYMKVIALALRHFQSLNRSETTGLRKKHKKGTYHMCKKKHIHNIHNSGYNNKSCGLFKVFENLYPPKQNRQRHQPSRIGDSLRWRSCASCRATSNELAMCKLRMIFSGKGCNLIFRIFKPCEVSLFWSYIHTYIYSCIF